MIALGTAQFGLDYGISNTSGRVSVDEVDRILGLAFAAGVQVIDTAWAYGDAETVLGTLQAPARFKIVTKLAPIDEHGHSRVMERLVDSMRRLSTSPLYGLLVHSANDLLSEDGANLALSIMHLRDIGEIEHIGISAYSEKQLFAALEVLDADLVQVPINVFDQRLLTGGALAKLKSRGIEIHARSAFLQGLLLMDPAELPGYFEPIRDQIEMWRAFCAGHELSPIAAALGFVTGLFEVDQVVVGVQSAQQLEEVLRSAAPQPTSDFAAFAMSNPAFVDPSCWPVVR